MKGREDQTMPCEPKQMNEANFVSIANYGEIILIIGLTVVNYHLLPHTYGDFNPGVL